MKQVGNPSAARLRQQINRWEQILADSVENSDSPDVIALRAQIDDAKQAAANAATMAGTAREDAMHAVDLIEPRLEAMEANGVDYAQFKATVTEKLSGMEDMGVDYTGFKAQVQDMIQSIELTPGPAGADGADGDAGKSAYQIARDHGYGGTETQWLATLAGKDGNPGTPGVTPNLAVGTVTTKPAGSTADATVTGTPAEPKLNLGIPQGSPGMTLQALGVVAMPTLILGATADVTATLNQAMPNTTYQVATTPLSPTLVGQVQVTVKTKTTTTVTLTIKALVAVGAGNILITAWG